MPGGGLAEAEAAGAAEADGAPEAEVAAEARALATGAAVVVVIADVAAPLAHETGGGHGAAGRADGTERASVAATDATPMYSRAAPAKRSATPARALPLPGLPPPEELLSGMPTFAMGPCQMGIPRQTDR